MDTVIVDPPRTGLDKTVPELITSFGPERIRGITVYGEAPETLPMSQLALTRQVTGDSTTGIYTYDGETKTIEYFRLSRLNTDMQSSL